MKEVSKFLPTSAREVSLLGWDYLDVIIFSADAYVDHPSFGAAVIGRLLEAEGYRVAIVPQPNWRDDLRDFRKLGRPRLFFGISGGAMDSMVNHYTAARRLRSDDAYTPGGKTGQRPDYPSIVYTKILKELYPSIPVVLGGIEASLRRLTHYDYWQDSLRPSILLESGADIISYGMGDKTMPEIARAMHNGFNMNLLKKIPQIVYRETAEARLPKEHIMLCPYEEQVADKAAFGKNFKTIETESNRMHAAALVEPAGGGFVVVNPPYPFFSQQEIDRSFDLPYTRLPHPRYENKGGIPAWDMIKFSVNTHRGCFGGCSFCTISAHQGKFISSRSERSILAEVERIAGMPGFGGTISDIGGPSANMYGMAGRDAAICEKCARASCIFPKVCLNLRNEHAPLIQLYRKVRGVRGVKRAFIGSGIRYDMFDGPEYLREVVRHHTGGRLKVAPEHTSPEVLELMRKPPYALFEKLSADFREICRKEDLPYQLIPYFISAHPGCAPEDMKELAEITRRDGMKLEQVQDFTPTPMTLSSVMYYTGKDPYTGRDVYVARTKQEKDSQKEYFFWYKKPQPKWQKHRPPSKKGQVQRGERKRTR